MNILVIAPIPPPVNGQSKASNQVYETLISLNYKVDIINLNRENLSKNLISQIKRFISILKIYKEIFIKKNNTDLIYFSISESYLGNMKDLLIYLLLKKDVSKVIIHMLGGSGMNKLLNKTILFSYLNGLFLKKINKVIIEGNTGYNIFYKYFSKDQMVIINNFVDDYLFIKDLSIYKKFKKIDTVNILFLSNMIPEKGYLELLYAFLKLPINIQKSIRLNFVGDFPEFKQKVKFLDIIKDNANVNYLGKFIDGDEKKTLYLSTHIFCLPTYYPYEGQPISILEAYASGCVVVTTLHGGIPDIFKDQINGYKVIPKDINNLTSILKKAVDEKEFLQSIALNNAREARLKFTKTRFRIEIRQLIDSIFLKKI